ncbi:MAG: hypothetical protein K8F33_01065 [Thermomonas sp.]|nr:hypothetical protein [Thermomonas sp.]
MDNRQAGQDPNVEAARKRARRMAWLLALVAVGLYALVFLRGAPGQ